MDQATPAAIDPDASPPPANGNWIEIDRRALHYNIDQLKRLFGDTELCMVVKGNAYGHGYGAVVPVAQEAGVRRFAVFSAREAANFLSVSNGEARLMVMGHADHRNLPWMVEQGLEPWINDPHDWPALRDASATTHKGLRVHLELETGMHRTGVDAEVAYEIAQEIVDDPCVELEGVCTHLAGAEDSDNRPRIEEQKRRYRAFLARLDEIGIRPNVRHLASSAAALTDPDCRLDMVRVGIACYGLWPSEQVFKRLHGGGSPFHLSNVLAWKSKVVTVKSVKDGQFVGYGTGYEAEGDQRVAVVAVGYADGFARDLSNVGHVLIRGNRASIIGTVNMNMVECHVTHIPDIEIGDEVVLIGKQGDREISVASFSGFNQVVNYELMSRLSWEVPRTLVDGPNLMLGAEAGSATTLGART